MSILLGILTFVLIIVSVFLVLIVLAQKTKDGGMGAVLGGGAAEAAFGADTANVLTKGTKYLAILFFTLAFALYLGRIYERKMAGAAAGSVLPTITAPAAPATPAAGTGAAATSPAAAGTTATPAVSVPTTPASTETPATSTPAPTPEQTKK